MSQNSFKKKLSSSEVGRKKMHDKYLTIKSKVDYLSFYGQSSPKMINHYDKITNKEYTFRYDNKVVNGEVRLYEMGLFYIDRSAVAGDEVYVKKVVSNNKIIYEIDLLRKGKSTAHKQNNLLPDEVNEDDA